MLKLEVLPKSVNVRYPESTLGMLTVGATRILSKFVNRDESEQSVRGIAIANLSESFMSSGRSDDLWTPSVAQSCATIMNNDIGGIRSVSLMPFIDYRMAQTYTYASVSKAVRELRGSFLPHGIKQSKRWPQLLFDDRPETANKSEHPVARGINMFRAINSISLNGDGLVVVMVGDEVFSGLRQFGDTVEQPEQDDLLFLTEIDEKSGKPTFRVDKVL